MSLRKTISLALLILACASILSGCGRVRFNGLVIKSAENTVLVVPEAGSPPARSADLISFSIAGLGVSLQPGDIISVTYDGTVMESYPAQIRAEKVKIIGWAEMLDTDTLTDYIWEPKLIYSERESLYFGAGGVFETIGEFTTYGLYTVNTFLNEDEKEEATVTISAPGRGIYNATYGLNIVKYNGTPYLFLGERVYVAGKAVEKVFYIYVQYAGNGVILGHGSNNAGIDYNFIVYCENAGDFRQFNTVRIECTDEQMTPVEMHINYADYGIPWTFDADMRVDNPTDIRLADAKKGEPLYD